MTRRSVIAGVGSALPQRRVTNAELASQVDTTDEWIVERTGIRNRYIAGDGETTGSLAIDAARAALAHAGIDHGLARGIGGERRGRLALAGDVAAADAGALDDPLVGGVDLPGELLIVDAAGGQSGAGAGEDGAEGHQAADPMEALGGCEAAR